MPDDNKIHFWSVRSDETSPCGVNVATAAAGTFWTSAWPEVTCGACKLERSLDMPIEYVIPQHVQNVDKGLALADLTAARVKMLKRRLATAQEVEQSALDCMRQWARTLSEAVKLRETTAQALSEALAAQNGQGYLAVGSAPSKPQGGSERAVTLGRHIRLAAPVNAVDIRTGVEETKGMTTQLSPSAQSKLLEAKSSHQGAMVPFGDIPAWTELEAGGLIGSAGGLTRKGSIERERLVAKRLDDAF